ncbi:MAG: extracellular solute-binding protein [Pleurocapsa sp. MO_192.B19]|nr:extracellular solute-binding protein [Pleurocapsa sp. MO_192.B19]
MNYHLSRRSFLRATTAIALTQLLLGCSNSGTIPQILFLEDSVPAQLIRDFRKTIGQENKINFKPQTQLYQIFDSLLNWQQSKISPQKTNWLSDKIFNKSVINPSLITLGDFWLQSAIKQNLIQPLSVKDIASWQKLPASWQKLVQRDNQGKLTANGMIWGAPYRWGSTVIAYRSDKLNQLGVTLSDWSDLWQPKLRERISLLDSPREVIGLTLKKLGHSYNTDNLNSIPELEGELLALHQQTKLYSLDHYLEPLILGDIWVAVAWSTDILPLLKRYPDIEFIIPQSGASLWADVWVKPQVSDTSLVATNSGNDISSVVEEWINFCWQPKAAKQISLFTDGISPILLSLKSEDIPQDLENNVFLNSEVLNSPTSEFLLPLTPETERQYRDLWLKIRQSG